MKTNETDTETKPKEVDPQVLAQQLATISDSMRKLLASGLNRKAVIVLLHHTSKVPQRDIEYVLDSLETLKQRYTSLK
jgi:siroheme synthase